MAKEEPETIHGHKVDIRNEEDPKIKDIVRGWKNSESSFRDMRHALEKDSNRKIRLGNIVFEKEGDTFIIRKSSSSSY